MPRWLLYSILTVVFWGVWGFLPRKLGAMSAEQSQVISALGLLPIMAVLGMRRGLLAGARPWRGSLLAFLAGLVGSVGNIAFYDLMNAGQNAATVVPLTSLYPLVTVVLAVVLLKEKLNTPQLLGVGLALGAIYFFNVGREETLSAGWLAFASLPVLFWGVAGLLQKLCTRDVSAELSTLCFLAALVVVSAGLLAGRPMRWNLTPAEWACAIALGLFLGLGNLTLLAAFAAGGQAAIVSPLAGLYSVVTVPLAVGLLGERVRPREWLAIALALGAVIALACERRPAANDQPAVRC
ncbi:MAG TPA: DMT family transporter [Methylomirabilota bacterium]|nr:DMT family transporter [Methylomirabilota bacterium]